MNARFVFCEDLQDVFVQGDKIAAITSAGAGDRSGLDLEGRLVIKGFCDVHTHLDKALLSQTIPNVSGTLEEAINSVSAYKANMGVEDIYRRASQALQSCYNHGTRYIITHVDVDKHVGLRGIDALTRLREEWRDRLTLQVVAFPQEGNLDGENFDLLEQALAMGVDKLGGLPAREANPVDYISKIFDLAQRYDVDIDMHVDETDDGDCLTILYLCDETAKRNYQHRVTVGHLCSLAYQEEERQREILQHIDRCGIKIVSLPSTNLYLQGRDMKKATPRGILPLKAALDSGIEVCIASDNMQDPFNPFGNGNLMEGALIAAHGCHMGGTKDLEKLFFATTTFGYSLFGETEKLTDNIKADFVVLQAKTANEAIITQSGIYGHCHNGMWQQ